jgi:hypothetical protein
MKPRTKTFDQWLKDYYPDWKYEESDCPDCNGTGRMDCPTCETDGALDCETCDGDGTVDAKRAHRGEYDRDVRSDLEAWSKWTGEEL